MPQSYKLAWRNLWRNKRRTFITMASIFLSVVLCTVMISISRGTIGAMVAGSVRFTTGHVQIHARGYWDDKTINNSIAVSPEMDSMLRSEKEITMFVQRLESYGLVSSGQHTKGAEIIGIEPEKENIWNKLSGKITKGVYFQSETDSGIMLGEGLAEYLHVGVGDSVVVLGQGYHGATAAGLLCVQGVFHYPIEEINNTLAYLSLPAAQRLFVAPGRLTSVSMLLSSEDVIPATVERLSVKLDGGFEVMDWEEMNPALVQMRTTKAAQWFIIQTILYTVVGFGIFGTILMMTLERKKEFAVMMALGLRKARLYRMLILETLLLCALGAAIGFIIALPVVGYMHWNPIRIGGAYASTMQEFGFEPYVYTALDLWLFLTQAFMVFIIALLSSAYPVWHVGKLKMMEALRG